MNKAIMSILTVWMFVCSMFIGLISFGDIGKVEASYIPHNPIRINSNAEFTSMAGLEGWVGDGSPGNPYIIEGYDINGSGYGYCIYIGNTTVYFEVRDSYLHEASGVESFPYYTDTGIIMYNVQNGTIANNTASKNDNGIHLYFSNRNTIANNNASSNIAYDIILSSSSSNIIANNTASSNNPYGIRLSSSDRNTITNNTASNNKYGISLDSSSNNTITNNTASKNEYGILFQFSSSCTMANNKMMESGIYILSELLEHWNTHNIDTTNTVNGKPVHYWKNRIGGIVPLGAGQVILVNSTNVVVENQNVSDGSVGIIIGFSNGNIITNNTASSNSRFGISLSRSSNNAITYNNASYNELDGIVLYESRNNTITYNNASSNKYYGLYLLSSSDSNTIANNIVSSSSWDGISVSSSSNNKISHNNIIENTIQARDNTNNSNQWDNGYPSGGNYWSDYIGNDSFKGPNQDIPGSDGIGDTPYIIDANSQDNYPLMQPYKPLENYMVLKQGWNLISIPLIQLEHNLTRVLGSIDSWYDAVQWYDITDTTDPWKHYKVGKPFGNDLSEINEKMGLWIHITNPGDTIFLYNGTQPTSNQSIPLHPGWNLVGFPSNTSYNRTIGLNNLTFDTHVDAIWTYNAATQKWKELGPSDYFKPCRGYWIHSKVECEWEVPL